MKSIRILGTAAVVLVLDQASKAFMRAYHPDSWLFSVTQNTGAAFSLFQNSALILAVISLVILAVLTYYAFKLSEHDHGMQYGMGLILGGGLGNVMDRLIFRSVTDFIDVHIWPVFNLADASAVVGVLIIAYVLIKKS